MTSRREIADAQLIINNVAVAYLPNSLVYTEGLGEQKMRVQSAGAGFSEVTYALDVSKNYSAIDFSLINTAENIESALTWKNNENQNAISIVSGDFTRNFSNCALLTDYEVKLGSETTIEIKFCGNQAT